AVLDGQRVGVLAAIDGDLTLEVVEVAADPADRDVVGTAAALDGGPDRGGPGLDGVGLGAGIEFQALDLAVGDRVLAHSVEVAVVELGSRPRPVGGGVGGVVVNTRVVVGPATTVDRHVPWQGVGGLLRVQADGDQVVEGASVNLEGVHVAVGNRHGRRLRL